MPPPLAHNSVPSTCNESNTAAPCNASNNDIKHGQRIIRSILYYAWAVDLTVLMALSTIASEEAKGTKSTIKKCKRLLDYLATYPNATVCFYASNMILNVLSDASYLSKANADSHAFGNFFHGLETGWDKTHQVEQGILHPLCNLAVCRCILCRSRTRCPLPKLQTGHNLSTYAQRNGTPSTSHPNQLQ